MATQMKDAQLRALLKTVEEEISMALASEAGKLAKAAGDEPEDEGSAPGGGEEAPAASPPPPAAEGSAEDPGASSAAPGEAPGEASGAPDAGAPADPAADPAAEGGGGDMEALKAEYMKLGQEDPEALKAHYLACVEALQAVMGGGDGGVPGAEASAPDAGGAPPAPGPEASGPPAPAAKMELGAIQVAGKVGDGKDRLAAVAAKKAELPGPPSGEDPTKKYEAALKEIEDLRKGQELLLGAVDKMIGSPMRKAVTGVAKIGGGDKEPKQVSRDEAKAILSQKLQSGKLQKSDRERVVAFTVGNLQLKDIQDLLA